MNSINNNHKILYVSGFNGNKLDCFIQETENSYYSGLFLTKDEFLKYDYSIAFELMPKWLKNKIILFLKTGKYDENCYTLLIDNNYIETFISKEHSISQAKKLSINTSSKINLDAVNVNSHIAFYIYNNDMNFYKKIETLII